MLLLAGLGFIYGSLEWIDSYYLRVLGFSIGLAVIAAAGYAGRSSALGLRSFGIAPWRRAKSTYENNSNEESHDRNQSN
jgi:hypothetical protein